MNHEIPSADAVPDRFKIAINNDEYYARYVGVAEDRRQFFLTTPFEPAGPHSDGSEYLALYTFDQGGELLTTEIDDFGPRAKIDREARNALIEARLASLGKWEAQRIEVLPFSVTRDGIDFGLIQRPLEDEDDIPAVEAQPGNYMAFFEPWDSGEYDT